MHLEEWVRGRRKILYNMFARNLKNYFDLLDGEECYRMKVARALKGLASTELYEKWEQEDEKSYREVNNLVYHIKKNRFKYYTFSTFSRDLWAYEYEAIEDKAFPEDIIEEQLKLIHSCLRGQYL